MKKIIISIIALVLLLPFNVFAKTSYNAETLKEACENEGIGFNHDGYQESDDKINIYLFRGAGCSHCHELLEFLSSIVDDYGKYFNVVSFETWNDKDNAALATKVRNIFKETQEGVPYLIIGNHTFVGYSATEDSSKIKDAIKETYNSEKKYDVLKDSDVLVEKTDYKSIIISGIVIVSIIALIIVLKKLTR